VFYDGFVYPSSSTALRLCRA